MKHRQPAPTAVNADDSKKNKNPVADETPVAKPVEVGGPKGPEPTRFGDWEKAGRCSDF